MKRKLLLLFGLLLILLVCCRNKKTFPEEPTLRFESLTKIDDGLSYDDRAVLRVYFTDGDGDVGLDSSFDAPPFDTASAYYYNFFITYYEKQNDVWVSPDELKNSFHARLPRFLSTNVEEPLEGYIDLIININNYYSTFDTIKFECYLVDRELHRSNVVESGEIIVRK